MVRQAQGGRSRRIQSAARGVLVWALVVAMTALGLALLLAGTARVP